MGDVIIYTDGDEDDHFSKVNLVLSRMLAAVLNINLAKCAFSVTQINSGDGGAHETAFDRMKEILICAPVLAIYDPELETVVEADSSGYGLGGVVSQVGHDDLLRPIRLLFSRKLPAAEISYQIHDKELLIIISAIKHFVLRAEKDSEKPNFLSRRDQVMPKYASAVGRAPQRACCE
ncbi:uncharacterized protein CPUR_03365 [Claviceps purpurea 20.1]|uniref:Reverse transcriptase/retrotransposon-derived protein RNase H-like domain-containing protein n=1 Tax=Claviceps purpurea (strain 20.1) TaxID=1111077 RepID=M1W8Y9_CLAP2|nr:uncharacterized protein CPUR_03365 [Claviceps purpurea 20.1]